MKNWIIKAQKGWLTSNELSQTIQGKDLVGRKPWYLKNFGETKNYRDNLQKASDRKENYTLRYNLLNDDNSINETNVPIILKTASDNTRVDPNNRISAKIFEDIKRQDATKLDDIQFRQKYGGQSLHRYNYENNPEYKSQVDKGSRETTRKYGSIDFPYTDSRSKSYTGNPNMQFMNPNSNKGELVKGIEDSNLAWIGAALPIPGVDNMGRIKGVMNLINSPSKLVSPNTFKQWEEAKSGIEQFKPTLSFSDKFINAIEQARQRRQVRQVIQPEFGPLPEPPIDKDRFGLNPMPTKGRGSTSRPHPNDVYEYVNKWIRNHDVNGPNMNNRTLYNDLSVHFNTPVNSFTSYGSIIRDASGEVGRIAGLHKFPGRPIPSSTSYRIGDGSTWGVPNSDILKSAVPTKLPEINYLTINKAGNFSRKLTPTEEQLANQFKQTYPKKADDIEEVTNYINMESDRKGSYISSDKWKLKGPSLPNMNGDFYNTTKAEDIEQLQSKYSWLDKNLVEDFKKAYHPRISDPTTGSYGYTEESDLMKSAYDRGYDPTTIQLPQHHIINSENIVKTEDIDKHIKTLQNMRMQLGDDHELSNKIRNQLVDLEGTKYLREYLPNELKSRGYNPKQMDLTLVSNKEGNMRYLFNGEGNLMGNVSTGLPSVPNVGASALASKYHGTSPEWGQNKMGEALYRGISHGSEKIYGEGLQTHGNFVNTKLFNPKTSLMETRRRAEDFWGKLLKEGYAIRLPGGNFKIIKAVPPAILGGLGTQYGINTSNIQSGTEVKKNGGRINWLNNRS